jgi:hypothetical protein
MKTSEIKCEKMTSKVSSGEGEFCKVGQKKFVQIKNFCPCAAQSCNYLRVLF